MRKAAKRARTGKRRPDVLEAQSRAAARDLRRTIAVERSVKGLVKQLGRAIDRSDTALAALARALNQRIGDASVGALNRERDERELALNTARTT